jgi:signal transduction histidine kinase
MRQRKGQSFRAYINTLLIAVVVADMAAVGSTILALRVAALTESSRASVDAAALSLSRRTEVLLDSAAGKLGIVARASSLVGQEGLQSLLEGAVEDSGDMVAAYVLDARGTAVAVGLPAGLEARQRELIGADFSNNPLFKALPADGDVAWSDKYLSGASGGTTVGVGMRMEGRVAIAEIPLARILETLKLAVGPGELAVLVVDRRGEVVADSDGKYSPGVDNLLGFPAVREAMGGSRLAGVDRLGGQMYQMAAARSELLGWTFIARVPVGMANGLFRSTVLEILALLAGTLLVGLGLAPLWSRGIGASVRALAGQARAVAAGEYAGIAASTRVLEFGELSANMLAMSKAIREREEALASLNAELEGRVSERTRDLEESNQELLATNESLRLTQAELVRSEKLAALGKLVAGVAHELNTPIGNALMAVSALKGERDELDGRMASGLSRAALAGFLASVSEGLGIAERNLGRAAQLVNSFKQVAVDQTSSQRRIFDLAEVTNEVLLTLQPTIKRTPYKIEASVPPGIRIDGFPGVFGQILANLVNNAVLHAFEGRDFGIVRILASMDGPGLVRFEVSDDGKGIPEENKRRVFEPFFTTKMGRGGTGLGLNIAHSAATDLLGGSLDFSSETGRGSTFVLLMPTVAPRLPESAPA